MGQREIYVRVGKRKRGSFYPELSVQLSGKHSLLRFFIVLACWETSEGFQKKIKKVIKKIEIT